jgi:hypothetical protein
VRFAALVTLVIAVHAVAIDWLRDRLEASSLLQPMAAPMFTRLLQPEAPAPMPATIAVAPSKPARPAVTRIAKGPKPAASAPAPESPPVAAAEPPAPPEAPASETPPEAVSGTPSAPETATVTAAPPASPASAPVSPNLDSWPADTRLNYRLSGYFRGELYGSARVQWQRQDERYQTRVDIDVTLFATLVLTSQGEVTPLGLSPKVYEESRRAGPRGVRLADDAITLHDGRRVPRPPGVQDTASQFVELSHRFATGQESLEVGRSVNVWLARPGAVDLWTYDIVARETLQTAGLGPIETFHLKPRPIANPRGNITAEMWFAPSLQYLPARIRVNMGTDTYVDLMVEKIEQR